MNPLETFANEHIIIFSLGVLILVVWTTIWKGLALWKSARLSSKWWFIALLLINTVGILEILYLFVFSKKEEPTKTTHSIDK